MSNKFKKIIIALMALPLYGYTSALNNKIASSHPKSSESASKIPTKSTTVANNFNAPTNTAPTISSDKVMLNFENADIQSVIKAISQLSNKNFVIDPRVKGTVNIVSDRPISKLDSYKVLESALRMQGFACVEADGVIKVLPEIDAKTYGMQTESSMDSKKSKQLGDQIVTQIFVIQHGSAIQLSNALRPLIAPNNSLSIYPNSNAIIITDYASNIKRIAKIINQLSSVGVASAQTPVILTMHHAVAADVAQILQSYMNGGGNNNMGGGGGGGAPMGMSDGPATTITVEPMSNSLILYSPIKDKLDELQSLAIKIDNNIANVNNDLHVVYLKNADANHVADVLRSVVSQQENPDLTATSSNAKFSSEPSSVFGATGSSGSGGGSSSSEHTSSTSRSNQQNNNSNNKDAPKVLVQAEPTTNSLIIQAPPTVYKNLRMIIDMLDVRRAQVMIEAMIADINSNEQGTFGIQWVLGGGNNNVGALAIANYGANGSALSNLAATAIAATGGGGSGASTGSISLPNEVYIGLVTGTTTIGGQTIPGLSALADMIQANSVGNILSRPTMITLDNEEARIMVGQNIGIPNGSYQNSGTNAGNLVTTITRQDLGTVLQIKPLITQNGSILLDIYQEDSKLDPNQLPNSPNGPSFLKRNMRATILVDDGQIIALGGMTQDSIQITANGIPGLASIPYLGWLFSWQSRTHIKSNMVLFLRPAIIRNASGSQALTNQRYNYIMGLQNQVQAKGNLILPTIKPINLENQVPYTTVSAPGNSNPSLNMNKNLPIVDLTNDGANVKNSNPAAISSSVKRVDVTGNPVTMSTNTSK